MSYTPAELPLIRLEDGSNDVEQSNHDQRPASQHDRRSSIVFPQQHMLQQPPPDLGPLPSPDDFDQMFLTTPMFGNAIEAPLVIPSPPSAQAFPTERRALLNLFGAASTEHPFRMFSIQNNPPIH